MEPHEEAAMVKSFISPIIEAKGWMKLLGAVMIVGGVLTALTVVGIIICWLPIWLGILLFQAAGAAERAQITGDKMQFLESLRKIKTYFVINGVLMLIYIVLMVLFMFLGLGTAMMGMGGY